MVTAERRRVMVSILLRKPSAKTIGWTFGFENTGGWSRNRTGVRGVAVRCM